MLGPTGVGKSFVACALAQKACRDGYSAFYTRAAALFRDLAIARADGSLRSLLARLSRIDVLVIDDWATAFSCSSAAYLSTLDQLESISGLPPLYAATTRARARGPYAPDHSAFR